MGSLTVFGHFPSWGDDPDMSKVAGPVKEPFGVLGRHLQCRLGRLELVPQPPDGAESWILPDSWRFQALAVFFRMKLMISDVLIKPRNASNLQQLDLSFNPLNWLQPGVCLGFPAIDIGPWSTVSLLPGLTLWSPWRCCS